MKPSCYKTRLLLVCLVVVACSWRAPYRDARAHTASVLARGKLTMLCFPTLDSPFVRPRLETLRERGVHLSELRDVDAYEGSDIELIRGFADFLGVELEIQPVTTTYRRLVSAVSLHQGDLAASSLTVTEEREKIVDFSDPIGSVWAVVATRLDSPILSLAELTGRKIRGNTGSSQVEIFRRLQPPRAEIVLGNFTLENYSAVIEGDVDFILMDSNAAPGEPAGRSYPEVKVMIRLEETQYGVAFPPGSDLRSRFNDYLARRSDLPVRQTTPTAEGRPG